MIYPNNAGEHLGFKSFREDLIESCNTEVAKEKFRNLVPYTGFNELHVEFSMLREVIMMLSNNTVFPRKDLFDIEEVFGRLHIQGIHYSVEELYRLFLAQKNYQSILEAVTESDPVEVNHWKVYLTEYYFSSDVYRAFDKVFDEEGKVKSNASPYLQVIRKEIIQAQSDLRKVIKRSLEKGKEAGFIEDDLEATIINGRIVLPVLAEHKRKIKGLIHGESNTGKTTYIEPTAVIDLNNRVTELELDEKREIIKILTNLTTILRDEEAYFRIISEVLSKADWFLSKANFAETINGVVPQVSKEQKLNLVKAVHPVLLLKDPEAVVPLDVELDSENRILVLSGPNAGGKSVALKTVGLLQYMFQCGIPISVDESSELSVFDKIMVEIGDHQSIKDDLSTYSGHLTDMKYFLENVDDKTLFLIDEFGSGTEPEYGAALAQNILLALNKVSAFGVVTTHFKDLKNIASKVKGLVNGAMMFDSEKLLPKFELKMGHPGSSYAFEVAKQIGLPVDLIQSAEKSIDKDKLKYDLMLRDLEKDREELDEVKKELANREKEIVNLANEYKELKQYYKTNKSRLIQEAKVEAAHIVKGANKDVERVIREIKESKADKEAVKGLRKKLDKHLKVENAPLIKPVVVKPIVEGEWVKMSGMNGVGKVLKLSKKRVEVDFNGIIVKTSLNSLINARKPIVSGNRQSNLGSLALGSNLNFNASLDVRGMRGEEVLEHFNQYMDKAIMSSVDKVKIIHGKGSGILRTLIRNEAKTYKEVDKIESEDIEQGGDGCTLIYFG